MVNFELSKLLELQPFSVLSQLVNLILGATTLAGIAWYDADVHRIVGKLSTVNVTTAIAACAAGLAVAYAIGLVISLPLTLIEFLAAKLARRHLIRRSKDSLLAIPGSWQDYSHAILRRIGIDRNDEKLNWSEWSPAFTLAFLRDTYLFNTRMTSLALGLAVIFTGLACTYRSGHHVGWLLILSVPAIMAALISLWFLSIEISDGNAILIRQQAAMLRFLLDNPEAKTHGSASGAAGATM